VSGLKPAAESVDAHPETAAVRESVQEAAALYDPASSHYRVARYPYSRFYALYDGDQLLALLFNGVTADVQNPTLSNQRLNPPSTNRPFMLWSVPRVRPFPLPFCRRFWYKQSMA